ncbi:MAG: FkbM family methyltransferase [Verrucomicrobia bacterium]|nr:FkbM family methyltransferase [Verrucomicrobiota bacterium]
MPRLSTRQKIIIAQILNRIVRLGRSVVRKPMQGDFTRNGLRWHLDLNEGIDLAIYLLGAFERDLVRCYERLIKHGDTVLDIGANIGAHTLPLARAVGPTGRVIAIEATEYAFAKLTRNIALNPSLSPNITAVHSLLISSQNEPHEQLITSSWPLDKTPSKDMPLSGATKEVGNAKAQTLDCLLSALNPHTVSCIKLDVDGHELSILRGATELLGKYRPSVYMELAPYCYASDMSKFEALLDIFRTANYTFRRLPSLKALPRSTEGLLNAIPKNGSINVLCNPPQGHP